jgi:hypothetical protein
LWESPTLPVGRHDGQALPDKVGRDPLNRGHFTPAELWDGKKRSATPSGFRDSFIAHLTDVQNLASASSHPEYHPTVSS